MRLLFGEDYLRSMWVHLVDGKISYCILKCELSNSKADSNDILQIIQLWMLVTKHLSSLCTLRAAAVTSSSTRTLPIARH